MQMIQLLQTLKFYYLEINWSSNTMVNANSL